MCCKYTTGSHSVLFLSSFSSISLSLLLSLYISLSPVSHTVCYCITVTYILLKKSLPVFITCVEMQSWKYQYLGKKKNKNNNNDVAIKTNLNCKYLYEEHFPSFLFLRSFIPFSFFWDLWEIFSRRCLSVLPSVLTVYSVCRFVSPGIHKFNFQLWFWFFRGFDSVHLFTFFLCATFSATYFLPALSAFCSQTLNCSKTSVEHVFDGCKSVW